LTRAFEERRADSTERRDMVGHGESSRSRVETQLEEWGAELQKLKAKVDKDIAEAKKEYYEHLEELRDDIESQVRKWGPEGEGLKELRAKIEAELKAWGPQIHSLHVAADKAETEAKRLIEDLKGKRKALKARLGEVKQAGDKAWEDVKTGTGKAWEELRPAIQSAIARFK
jgi:DNA repair exonuclease SbcCD ATPase subunit